MSKVRFLYSKTGRAKYISHLDLMSVMQRSFLRAGVNLKYSEGFNPHPYMSVALPLSVGNESICELIDVGVADGRLPDLRSIKMPEGIVISEVYTPSCKFNDITWIEIVAEMLYDRKITVEEVNELKKAFAKKPIIISKKTKRGVKELDIAPFIKDVEISVGERILLKAKVSAQNPTINSEDIVSAFGDTLKPDCIDLKRIEIYDSNMVVFR